MRRKPPGTRTFGWRFYGDALSVSADVYRSNYNNKQESAFDDTTGYTYYTSVKRMHMQGFSSEASYKLSKDWTAYASYTYTQAKIVGSIDGGATVSIRPMARPCRIPPATSAT